MYYFLVFLVAIANCNAIESVIGTRQVQDQCHSNSECSYRGICKPVPNIVGTETNLCHCSHSFTGSQCQYAACRSNPCFNDGICEEIINGEYMCHCPLGFTGYHCEFIVENTACSSNPCVNGLCRLDETIDKAVCDCFYHFTGPKCDQTTQCDWTSCSGHGDCYMKNGQRQCKCNSGWKGDQCQIDIDECDLNLQLCNSGTCQNMPGSYVCHCSSSHIGSHCEIVQSGSCEKNPCQNGGFCRPKFNEITRQFFTCTCAPGFTGNLCQQNINECAPYQDADTANWYSRCDNGGICIDAINEYKCRCMPGHTGPDCHDNVNECALFGAGYCLNGGTCLDEYGSVKCACVIGFTGLRCESSIDDCVNNMCHPESKCIDGLRRYDCQCPSHRMGIHCEFLNPCVTESPCNNGECFSLAHLGTYKCKCKPGYTGSNCDQDINECLTDSHLCYRGTCVNLPGSFRCDCDVGFVGEYCDERTDECNPQPCMNGGTCIDKTADFDCLCMSSWTGKVCDEPKPYVSECTTHYCLHGGVCQKSPLGIESCVCLPRFTGNACEYLQTDPCSVNLCQNNGVCMPTNDMKSFTCACTPGFAGVFCDKLVDSCESFPCIHGTCLNLITPNDAPFTCSCDANFFGSRCERRVSDCASNMNTCNSGICIDTDVGFTCACPSSHTGLHCEIDVTSPCQLSPCLNDGVCLQIDIRGNFRCTCPAGFSGSICQFGSEMCSSASCLHGAICDASGGCQCAPGYNGKHCEHEINRCAREICRNGGTCQNIGHTGFVCHCAYGYAGSHCTLKFNVDKFNDTEKAESKLCKKHNCSFLSGNGVCDDLCNLPGCDFDGGDCSSNISRPLAVCPYEKYCKYVLNNGICDELCNNEACLFDGFDCIEKSTAICSEIKFCEKHYGDNICDPICNIAGCGWDGGDCSRSIDHKLLNNTLKLIIMTDADRFVERETQKFLMTISNSLHVAARFQTDKNGHPMVFRWSQDFGQGELIKLPEAILMKIKDKDQLKQQQQQQQQQQQRTGVVIYLVLDVSICHVTESLLSEPNVEAVQMDSVSYMAVKACFTKTSAAANLLALESNRGVFNDMNLKIAKAEAVVSTVGQRQTGFLHFNLLISIVFAACFLIIVLIVVARIGQKRKIQYVTNVYDCDTHNLMHKSSDASNYNYITGIAKRSYQSPQQHQLSYTPLHAKVSSAEPIHEITPDEIYWVTAVDNDGQTCIHCTVNSISTKPENVIIDDIDKLIAAGADVTAVNNNKETALHVAIIRERIQVALHLLPMIDINAIDKNGFTPLYLAVSLKLEVLVDAILAFKNVEVNMIVQSNLTPLILCAKMGDCMLPIAQKLLAHPSIEVNKVGDKFDQMFNGQSAIHAAAISNSIDIIKLLIKKGSHVATMDANMNTPLFLAVRERNVEIVKLLLERMPCSAVYTSTDEDQAPLDYARTHGYDEIVKLIETKLDIKTTPMPVQHQQLQIPQVATNMPSIPYQQHIMPQSPMPIYSPINGPLRSIENISINRVTNSPRAVKRRASNGQQGNHNNSFNSDSAYSSDAYNTSANNSNSFNSGVPSFAMSPNASNFDQASLITMIPNQQYYANNQNLTYSNCNTMYDSMQMPQQQQMMQMPQQSYMPSTPNFNFNMTPQQQQQHQSTYPQMFYGNQH